MPHLKSITIKEGKERAMENRHPWIFSGAVDQMADGLQNGDIVDIKKKNGKRIGYGFYAPGNQIVCRVFEYATEDIDVDKPEYWKQKLSAAQLLRKSIINPSHTNCYRLVHAEGDFMPGLIADVYNDTVVVQFLIKGMENIKDWIVDALLQLGYDFVYEKGKKVTERVENVDIARKFISPKKGNVEVDVIENGVKFRVNIEDGQKTGFFLDQRDARELLASFSQDKKVLNTFSYSGGFSMYALQAGASLVHSVDISKKAIDLCNDNVQLNGFNNKKHEGFAADCFDFLRTLPTDYDVIILDPPAFAKSAKTVKNAARGYKELNMLAFRNCKPGGIVFTFSCSQNVDRDLFRKIVFGAAADAKRNVQILYQTTQPPDHPINIYHPENEYLKGLVLHVS